MMTLLTNTRIHPIQGPTPIVSGLAGSARVPNIQLDSQSQARAGDSTVSTNCHSTASETQIHDRRPQAFNVYASRALDPASSVPITAGLRDGGNMNLYTPRPSTAPVFAPVSLIPDLPPQKEATPTLAPPYSKHAPSGKPSPFTFRPESGQQMLARVPLPGHALPLDAATSHNAHHMSNAVGGAFTSLAAIKQARAEDIDTQKLLDKAAARRRPSKNEQKYGTVARTPAASHCKAKTASQKRRRNLRCTHCRTKRIKCGFNEDNPKGACQPCLDQDIPCSFGALAKDVVGIESLAQVKPEVQVPNSPETAVNESQVWRLSLRSPDIQPIDLTNKLVSQEVPIKELKQARGTISMAPSKRPSQLALPVPKRFKPEGINPNRTAQGADYNPITKEQTPGKLGLQDTKSQQAVHELSNILRDLRSDATTATVDTLDLDPPDKPHKVARNFTPPRPPYSELSASTGQAEPADQENIPRPDEQEPKSIANNNQALVTTTGRSAFDLLLAELTNLDGEARNTWLDKVLIEVLEDESFIPFCKIIDSRWEQHLFNLKL